MERYTALYIAGRPVAERYGIRDNFSGDTVVSGIKEADEAQQRADRMNAEYKKAAAIADQIATFVNGFDFHDKDFAKAMGMQHRTLQQNFTRLVIAWIEHLAALEENHYDARNEGSVRLAKQLVASSAWEKNKYLAHI